MAWIAQNVKADIVGDESLDGEDKKLQVVLGGEEKDLLERERLQEAQRYVTPVWIGLMKGYKTPYRPGTPILPLLVQLPHLEYRTTHASRLCKQMAPDIPMGMMRMRTIFWKPIMPKCRMEVLSRLRRR